VHLGFRMIEERVGAQNCLEFNDFLFYFLFFYGYLIVSVWGFMVLINKRKGLTWGSKEEGKERNL
jgi:hypothetical protein